MLLHALEHLGDPLGAAVVLAVARRRDLVGARELGLGGAKVAEEDVRLGERLRRRDELDGVAAGFRGVGARVCEFGISYTVTGAMSVLVLRLWPG